MRALLISDIHANYVALNAVLNDAGEYDVLWCLGDIIGYGPRPNECVERVRTLNAISLVGNHDLACIGELDTSDFNPLAREASAWTAQQLTDDSRAYLDVLPPMRRIDDRVTLAHGSPREPVWEYLLEEWTADVSFEYFETQICFVGHTHVPTIFACKPGQPCKRATPRGGDVLTLNSELRYIINPGSVGQPRDRDARAAYAIYDSEANTVAFRRAAYAITKTQQQIRDVGLPELLGDRLSFGM